MIVALPAGILREHSSNNSAPVKAWWFRPVPIATVMGRRAQRRGASWLYRTEQDPNDIATKRGVMSGTVGAYRTRCTLSPQLILKI